MTKLQHSNSSKKAGYYLGIDIGSISSKAVLISDDHIVSYKIVSSRGTLTDVAEELIQNVIQSAGITSNNIFNIAATGYGSNCVSTANLSINDVTSAAKGISYLNPSVRTVVDLGGQFSKAFRVDSRGLVL